LHATIEHSSTDPTQHSVPPPDHARALACAQLHRGQAVANDSQQIRTSKRDDADCQDGVAGVGRPCVLHSSATIVSCCCCSETRTAFTTPDHNHRTLLELGASVCSRVCSTGLSSRRQRLFEGVLRQALPGCEGRRGCTPRREIHTTSRKRTAAPRKAHRGWRRSRRAAAF
jgi:hypothetical protein